VTTQAKLPPDCAFVKRPSLPVRRLSFHAHAKMTHDASRAEPGNSVSRDNGRLRPEKQTLIPQKLRPGESAAHFPRRGFEREAWGFAGSHIRKVRRD
jgi:hypothetical protein